MSAPRPKSRDFGAAMSGLVLGGSVMFLIVLTIVWLTNSHYSGLEHEKAGAAPAATHTAPPTPPATP